MNQPISSAPDPTPESTVTLREVTAETVRVICDLKVGPGQERFVAPNAVSIAQAHFSDRAWFRAVYAGESPVGFVMVAEEEKNKRYFLWLKDILTGDLGNSIADDQPVTVKIGKAFWPTLSVNLVGLAVALIVSVPIGILAAAWHESRFDRWGGALLYMLYSIPSYVGAIVLILFVSVKCGRYCS